MVIRTSLMLCNWLAPFFFSKAVVCVLVSQEAGALWLHCRTLFFMVWITPSSLLLAGQIRSCLVHGWYLRESLLSICRGLVVPQICSWLGLFIFLWYAGLTFEVDWTSFPKMQLGQVELSTVAWSCHIRAQLENICVWFWN
jgi:hypothetical protein